MKILIKNIINIFFGLNIIFIKKSNYFDIKFKNKIDKN